MREKDINFEEKLWKAADRENIIKTFPKFNE